MANKIYHISIQSVFFTTTLTAEEGSTFRAMKYNPGVIVECTEPNGKKTYSFHDQFVRTPAEDSLEELIGLLESHLLIPGETLVVSKRHPYYIVSTEEREERLTQPEELGKYLTKQYGEWEEFEWINDNGAFIWCKPWSRKAVYMPVGNTIIRG